VSAPAVRAPRAAGGGGARGRRGAVLPLVCVVLVALLGPRAWPSICHACTRSRWSCRPPPTPGRSPAARALQDDPGNGAGDVGGEAVALATSNPVFGRRPTAVEVAVDPMARDDAGTSVAPTTWASANAVRVTVTRTTPFVFGGFMNLTPPTIRRQATAWVANVTRATCVRPLGLPFQYVWEKAGRTGKPTPNDKLTADEVKRVTDPPQNGQGGSGVGRWPADAALAAVGAADLGDAAAHVARPRAGQAGGSRTQRVERAEHSDHLERAERVHVRGRHRRAHGRLEPERPRLRRSDKWSPVSVEDNNSGNDYADQFDPTTAGCAGQSVSLDGSESGRALNGSRIQRDTHDGLARLCGTTSAQCNGPDGVTLRVGWVSTNGAGNKGGSNGSSANAAQFRMVSYVRMVCYFGAAYDGRPSAPSNCPSTNYQGRPPGTMLIEVLPPTAGSPMPGDEYGNAASGIQRLMLVR
jgi:hypothetical protein